MGIGVSILLMAVGAILWLATDLRVSGVDLDVVGIILVVAGALGLLVTLMLWSRARRAVVDVTDPAAPVEAPPGYDPTLPRSAPRDYYPRA